MKPPSQPDKDKKRQLETVVKYSGLGLEMTAAIVCFALLGQWLDGKMGNERAYMTILFCFVGVAYVLFRIMRIASK